MFYTRHHFDIKQKYSLVKPLYTSLIDWDIAHNIFLENANKKVLTFVQI